MIKRRDIWIADLRPGRGREVVKKRPVVIVSKNEINSISPTVIIVPISSQIYPIMGPERIFLTAEGTRLEKDSVILTYQIRAIDKERLVKKIGALDTKMMHKVDEALRLILDLL